MKLKNFSGTQVHYYLTATIAFCIPAYPVILSPLIILLALNRFINPDFIRSFKKIEPKWMFFIFISLYALYAIGLIYSSNLQYGLKDLETKFSLLLLPVLFFTSPPFDRKKMNAILWIFIIGCLVSFLTCVIWGSYNYIDEQLDMRKGLPRDNFRYYYFFSSRFSFFLHPSYLSMYVVFALMALYQFAVDKVKSNGKIIFISVCFIIFILLLDSKAGILTLILFGIYFIWRKIVLEKKIMQSVMIMCLFIAAIATLYFTVSEFANRINKTIEVAFEKNVKADADDSSSKRVLVWEASREVITENWLTGVGTGDAKDVLLEKYKQKGMDIEYKAGLNSHNQYLQTFIAIGIIGFLILFLSLAGPAFYSIKNKHFLYGGFILFFSINIFVESMFETQAGVIFYAFFNSILASQMNTKSGSDA